MNQKALPFAVVVLLVALFLAYLLRPGAQTDVSTPREDAPLSQVSAQEPTLASEGSGEAEVEIAAAVEGEGNEPLENSLSDEMRALVDGVYAGRLVRMRVGEEERDFMFRPLQVTTDGFKISLGPDDDYSAEFEVFQGREVLSDGSLAESATMAVVNDAVSMTYSTDDGQFLVELGEEGRLVSKMVMSREEGSTWGHWACETSGHACGHEGGTCSHGHGEGGAGLAGVRDLSGDSPRPPEQDVEITLASDALDEPDVAGARVDHPFFRLGPQYDASLRDIQILMVSSKSQTGATSGLSSRASTYFSYAATLADVYERQLGMRVRLQELILIPSDSSAPDIESPDIASQTGSQQLAFLRDWAQLHRPQNIHRWGHVMGWTLVDGSARGTVGWAWTKSYGGNFGASVNEREYTWGVIAHELGHNVGANHTNGGTMNASVSRTSPSENFFRPNNTGAGNFTGAKEIYDYMSNPTRALVSGRAPLRNPDEMPFANDDSISTATNTSVAFNPISNDNAATPFFGQTNTSLSLVEVGQVFPRAAGSAVVVGNQILFTPATGFTGRAWFTYTLRGNLGNGGFGWLHSADVIVTVGGNTANPSQTPALSTQDDLVESGFDRDIRINPLLNDEGRGRLWAGPVEAVNFANGNLVTSDGSFRLVSASVMVGNGTIMLETADVNRGASNTQDNTGYVVYRPGANEPDVVTLQVVVADSLGNQTTGFIHIHRIDPVEIMASGTVIGTNGTSGNTRDRAFDRNLDTFFDATTATGGWTGLDLGTPRRITRIGFSPRATQPARMNGGQFQGSSSANFSSGVVTLYTIPTAPPAGVMTEVRITDPGSYRYVRYIGPSNGFCNVAEIEFYFDGAPVAPTGLAVVGTGSGQISLDWQDNAESDLAGYRVYRSTTAGVFNNPPVAVATSSFTDTGLVNGTTYHYAVSAVDVDGFESRKSSAVSETLVVNDFPPVVNAGLDQSATISGSLPWTPAEITTAAWFDASDETSIAVDSSGNVSQWNDMSGNDRHIGQSAASQRPAFLNSTVSFDGSNDLLFNMQSFMYQSGAVEIFFAGSVSGTTVDRRLLAEVSSTNATPVYLPVQSRASSGPSIMTAFIRNDANSVRFEHSNNLSATGAFDLSTRRLYQVTDTGSQMSGRVNAGAPINVSYTRSGAMTLNSFGIGGIPPRPGTTTGSSFIRADLNEMIIAPLLQPEEREIIEGYLAHKWGMEANLPANHPYKELPPGGASVLVDLNGSATDADGNALTITWSVVSGPAEVRFAEADAESTTARFTMPGTYVLRLTAFDGFFTSSDEVTITITEQESGFTVVYHGNGNTSGTVPIDPNNPYPSGAEVTVLDNVGGLSLAGFSFAGWNTQADGSGTSLSPGQIFQILNNTTLYARWDAQPADSNNNGIDDAWELATFGRVLSADEVIHESGVPYYFMYLHGTDLANPADRFRVTAVPNSQGEFVMGWEMREPFVLGVDYQIGISTNLSQWDSLPPAHYTIQQTPVGSRNRIELTLTHDYGARVFLRLEKP